jgi:hypothetical protein
MRGWLDSNWLRASAYLVAFAAAFLAGWRERRNARDELDVWPTFWFITAGLFLTMAIGRAAGIGGLVTQLGRSEAFSQGWYDHRRALQVIVAGSVGAIWSIAVLGALWGVPARRRRYVPASIVVFTLICFVGIRLVSLHQIDGLLYRRDVAGLRVDAALELVGVSIAAAVTFWRPRTAPGPLPPPAH